MPPGCLPSEDFWAHLVGRRLCGRPQNKVEGLYILSGSGKPRDPPGGAGDIAGGREGDVWTTLLASDGLLGLYISASHRYVKTLHLKDILTMTL